MHLTAAMHQGSLTDREFVSSLDGLRGVAVLYVVVSHLGNGGRFLLPVPHDAIGKIGVWIFFALSAFLLTTHLRHDFETEPSKISPLLQYAVHRIFRIYPLFISVLIMHVILGDISGMELIKHLLLIQGWEELWAVPVEFQYYFIIPLIAIGALHMSRRSVVLLLMLAVMLALFYGIMQPASVFSNGLNIIPKLTPFLLGSILALFYKKSPAVPGSGSGFVFMVTMACFLTLLVATVLYRCIGKECLSNLFAPWLSLAIGASVAGLIYSGLRPSFVGSMLGAKPLAFIGRISFSIYLLHMTVIRFVHKIPGLPPVAEAWLSLGLSVLCASITYWSIERTGIRAGKQISRKLSNANPWGQRH